MNNPISPFEKWRLETIPQVGFTPEIRELLAMAFEGGRQSVKQEDYPSKEEILNKIFDAVYTQYPKKEWQSLSDDEMKIIQNNSWIINADGSKEFNTFVFARAIEQASRKKNHDIVDLLQASAK